jgi:solute carrier family 25 protein 16
MLLRIFPYAALNFMCYEQYKRVLPAEYLGQPLQRLLAGSSAGATAVFFTYPFDYVRAVLAYQVKTKRYRGITHAIVLSLREGGIRALYKGFGPTMLGILPYAGLSFSTYETLKQYLFQRYPEETLDEDGRMRVPYKLLCGAVAGAVAQTGAYPLDVIRRHMQLYGLATEIPKYRNTWDALQTIVAKNGIKGLFVGLSINYFKVAPAMALSFVSYEYLKRQFGIESDGSGL